MVVGGLGSSGDTLTSVEAYSPQKRYWKPLPDVPMSVRFFATAAVGDDIFVSGQTDSNWNTQEYLIHM